MKQINDIVQYFIDLDTTQIIKDIAAFMLQPTDSVNDPVESFPKVIGIMILAVEDAKTSKESSSNNDLYLEIYNKAKQILKESSDNDG